MRVFTMALLCLLAGSVMAQTEFMINTQTDTTQRNPKVVIDGAGNRTVIWTSLNQAEPGSDTDIYLRVLDNAGEPQTGEVLVNETTAGRQERPSAAMAPDGTLLVVWASHEGYESIFDIKGRLVSNGEPTGSEFLINSTTANSQTKPDVAVDQDGNFVVVWESWYQDGSQKGVFAQRLDAAGTPLGDEFQVNTTTVNSQGRPAVDCFANGSFVIIWESWKQDILTETGYGLFGRVFDKTGSALTDEFQVNTYTNDYQWFGDVAALNETSFAAAWCSWRQDGHDGGIYLQKFDAEGNKLAEETRVNMTTQYYQWLPVIKPMASGDLAVVWSSWLQDGDREGVYARMFDENLKPLSFEEQVNTYTTSFQWEPDFVTTPDNELFVVWSSWGQVNNSYEIMGASYLPVYPQGAIDTETYSHVSGTSSTRLVVHVVDSLALTGAEYRVTFQSAGEYYTADITNTVSGETVIDDYPLSRGENAVYLTPVFEGLMVEFKADLSFGLDLDYSYFYSVSGTNVMPRLVVPSGSFELAPIDAKIVFGNSERDNDGNYVSPMDTAYSVSGVKEVVTPFRAWNVTDDEKIELFISESASTQNQRWDPGEAVILITPPQYETQFPNFHAQVSSVMPENPVYPNEGDVFHILTARPISGEDEYTFTADRAAVTTGVEDEAASPYTFGLEQNYPNPFNPVTTIVYSINEAADVTLKVYDVLGREVATLVNRAMREGEYKVSFDGAALSTGVYFYVLRAGSRMDVQKMMLLK